MDNVSTQPQTAQDLGSREEFPTALGVATLLFITGFAIGSGRYRKFSEKSARILGALGVLTFDRISSTGFFEEQRHAG